MPVLDYPISKKDWDNEVGARNGVSIQLEEASAAEAGAWQPAIQKIIDFQHLKDDWDDNGAKAPSGELLDSAVALAWAFCKTGMEPPSRIVPGVTGTVLLEWQLPDGTYGEVEIVRPFYAEVMMIQPGRPPKHWTLPTDGGFGGVLFYREAVT
jgi:hypothetical protein